MRIGQEPRDAVSETKLRALARVKPGVEPPVGRQAPTPTALLTTLPTESGSRSFRTKRLPLLSSHSVF